jgi:hypothetical protein
VKKSKPKRKPAVKPRKKRIKPEVYVTLVTDLLVNEKLIHTMACTASCCIEGRPIDLYKASFEKAIGYMSKRTPAILCIIAMSYDLERVCDFLTALAHTEKLACIPYIVILPDIKGSASRKIFSGLGAAQPLAKQISRQV